MHPVHLFLLSFLTLTLIAAPASAQDGDRDALDDETEATLGTDPNDADTDDDGLRDGAEVLTLGTDPLLWDSDGDGLSDGQEVGLANPTGGPDTDLAIFVPDADPSTITDALNSDTDLGGALDGGEDINRNGALDPGEGDPLDPSDDLPGLDLDGDGFCRLAACFDGSSGGDCDDNDPAVNPGAAEVCDAVDNNCDGQIDEGAVCGCGDEDADGFTDAECGGDDCDDSDPLTYPGASETCDMADNNCDGQVDEGLPFDLAYRDWDRDGFGNPNHVEELCGPFEGWVGNGDDCNDEHYEINPNAPEVCDFADNNCDGQVDEGVGHQLWYRDMDGDGFGNPNLIEEFCEAPAEGWVTNGDDCDDELASVHPGATEVCDWFDNDCDGQVDEGSSHSLLFRDYDEDGFGNPNRAEEFCEPPLEGWVSNDDDCNDENPAIHFGATEICDWLDNDCDGQVDDGINHLVLFRDEDGDGFGNPNRVEEFCEAPLEGWAEDDGDCNDENPAVNPGAPEICDGTDNDCDELIDEGVRIDVFRDADEDGYGNPEHVEELCEPVEGWVENGDDCNDENADINPEADEVCDELDNNCDGQVDEGVLIDGFRDEDGDGFGNPEHGEELCELPEGFVENGDDCNDGHDDIHPEAVEVSCDELDNDCDGEVDEGAECGDIIEEPHPFGCRGRDAGDDSPEAALLPLLLVGFGLRRRSWGRPG